jgi:hypothetical protein
MAIAVERILSSGGDDRFDSLLQKTDGKNIHQNAWLTVELKVKLNFVDATNPIPGKTVTWSSGTYQEDADNWLFPIQSWTAESKKQFADRFQSIGESTWNYRFLLLTPQDYSAFDFSDPTGVWLVRPNVICLFRTRVVDSGLPVDASKTISGSLIPHQTINVVRLQTTTTTVHRTRIPAGDTRGWTLNFRSMDNHTFRSDSADLDHLDLGGQTLPHEVGHMLGQGHIKCLGSNPIPICSTNPNAPATYGTTSAPDDGGNVMGGGNAVTVLNAQPWKRRIAQHTYHLGFTPTMTTGTLPRSVSVRTWIGGQKHF